MKAFRGSGKLGFILTEAALIIPLAIISMVLVIQLILCLYLQTAAKVYCDRSTRFEAGKVTETILGEPHDSEKVDKIKMTGSLILGNAVASINKDWGLPSLAESVIDTSEWSRYQIADESRFIRDTDLIVDGLYSAYEQISDRHEEE